MRPGQLVTTPDGRQHRLVESWSPDGLAGPTGRTTPRRIRYTFRDLGTGKTWTTYDQDAFAEVPVTVGA